MVGFAMAAQPSESELDVAMRRELHSRGLDAVIAAIASRQYGVIARFQLLGFGLSPSSIDRRVRAGRLHVIHLKPHQLDRAVREWAS